MKINNESETFCWKADKITVENVSLAKALKNTKHAELSDIWLKFPQKALMCPEHSWSVQQNKLFFTTCEIGKSHAKNTLNNLGFIVQPPCPSLSP